MEVWQEWLCVILMAAVGVYCLLAAVCNWNWFFGNRRAQLFVGLFGRTGARIAYGLLGAVIIALSVTAMVTQLIL